MVSGYDKCKPFHTWDQEARTADRADANFVASHRTLGVIREKMASSSNQEEGKASRKHGFYLDDCFKDALK